MTNLENMVNEKEDKMYTIQSKIVSALTEEEKKYKSRVEDIKVKGAADLNRLEQKYTPKLAESLMNDLNRDVDVMGQKAKYCTYSKEKINEITNLKKVILGIKSKIKDEDGSVDSLLRALPKKTQKLLNELPNIENMQDKAIITTYVSSNGAGCYILTPVSGNPLDKFSKEIENKLLGVINVGKVGVGKDFLYFEGESPEYVNNFLMFKIETSQPEFLKKELIKKLNDEHIQPSSFKEGNMIHRAISLDFNILKNFMNYKEGASEEQEVKISGKRGPYKKKSKANLESSVVSHESLGSKGNEKYGHSAIYPKYVDPKTVIDAYNTINDKFRKENGNDMRITKILIPEIGGKGRWALYDSLVNHIKNGTIKPEDIHSSSELERYVNGAILKSEKDYQNVGDIHPMESQTDVMNAKTGNHPTAEYEQFKSKYDALTEKYGHPLTRTEMYRNKRSFYEKMSGVEEATGVKFDFIPNLKNKSRGNYAPRKKDKKKD